MSLDLQTLGIAQLSVPERIELVGAIWDSILVDNPSPPISEEQKELIERRLANYEANPTAVVPWEEAFVELKKQPKK